MIREGYGPTVLLKQLQELGCIRPYIVYAPQISNNYVALALLRIMLLSPMSLAL